MTANSPRTAATETNKVRSKKSELAEHSRAWRILTSHFLLVLTSEHLFPHRQVLDQLLFHPVPRPRLVRHVDHSFARYFHFGLDDVFFPIALRRRYIARQPEIFQRRE